MTPFPSFLFAELAPEIAGKLRALVSRSLSTLGEHGYEVMVSVELEELESFRRENPEHHTPNTAFDLRWHPHEVHAQGLFLMRDGRRVGTVWRRIIPLRNRRTLEPLSLKDAFEGLHVFYDDPLDATRRETCSLNNTLPKLIDRGSICYGGFAYFQPQHQRLGLFRPLSDLALVLSITSAEQWDWFVALSTEEGRERAIAAFPYRRYEWGMKHNGDDYWLCTASYEEIVSFALKAAES